MIFVGHIPIKKPSCTQPIYHLLWKWQEAGGHIWNLQVPRVLWTLYCPLPASCPASFALCPYSDLPLRLICSLPTSLAAPLDVPKAIGPRYQLPHRCGAPTSLLRHPSHPISPSRSSSGSLLGRRWLWCAFPEMLHRSSYLTHYQADLGAQ